jgi:hypothetical protein
MLCNNHFFLRENCDGHHSEQDDAMVNVIYLDTYPEEVGGGDQREDIYRILIGLNLGSQIIAITR